MKINSVFLGDIELGELNLYMLRDHENPLMAGMRERIVAIPNRPGAYDYGADLEPISFKLPLGFIRKNGTEIQQTVRDIKKLLIDGNGKPKTFKLIFGYESDKYYNVRFTGEIPIERILGQVGTFNLSLICHEGHAWSTLSNQDVFWGSEHIYFSNNTYTFGHSASAPDITGNGGEFNVVVVGDNVRPVITLVGVGNNVAVAWDGKLFSIGTISGTVIVDLHEYVVLRNGTFALSTISGDWLSMHLTHGSTNINVTGSDLDLTINVEFHDRFF